MDNKNQENAENGDKEKESLLKLADQLTKDIAAYDTYNKESLPKDTKALSELLQSLGRETKKNQLVAQQPNATVNDVANWLLSQVTTHGMLTHEAAVYGISEKFGDSYIYLNPNGNPAIPPKVRRTFNKISGDTVVWDSYEELWRLRRVGDSSGRRVE